MKKNGVMGLVTVVLAFHFAAAMGGLLTGCATNGTFYDESTTTTTYDLETGEITTVTVDTQQIRNEARSSMWHNSETVNETRVTINPDGSSTFIAGGEAAFEGQGGQIVDSLSNAVAQFGKSDMTAFLEYLTAVENAKAREAAEEE